MSKKNYQLNIGAITGYPGIMMPVTEDQAEILKKFATRKLNHDFKDEYHINDNYFYIEEVDPMSVPGEAYDDAEPEQGGVSLAEFLAKEDLDLHVSAYYKTRLSTTEAPSVEYILWIYDADIDEDGRLVVKTGMANTLDAAIRDYVGKIAGRALAIYNKTLGINRTVDVPQSLYHK